MYSVVLPCEKQGWFSSEVLQMDLEDPRFFVSFQLLMDFMAINYKSVISTIVFTHY